MKVDFANISKDGYSISLDKNGIKFTILASKLSKNVVKCEGKIQGLLMHICDRCGEEFELFIDEDIDVLAYGKIAEISNNKLENIIEFFDGFIDFDEIFISELESKKSDYNYCQKCTN